MNLSITFVDLWHKNLSTLCKVSIEHIKLLGSYGQLDVSSESLRVKHSNGSVFYGRSMCIKCVLYTFMCNRYVVAQRLNGSECV